MYIHFYINSDTIIVVSVFSVVYTNVSSVSCKRSRSLNRALRVRVLLLLCSEEEQLG